MLVSTEIDPKTNHVTCMHVSKYEMMCLFTTHIPSEDSHKSIDQLTHIEVRYAKSHNFKDPLKTVSEDPLRVPLEPDVAALETVKIKMHHSPTTGYDMGASCNEWFSSRFGFDVKLLYIGENRRKVLGNVAPSIAAKQSRGELPAYAGLKNKADEEAASAGGWLGGLTSAIKSTVGNVSSTLLGGASNDEDGIDQGITFSDVAPFLIINSTSHADAAARFSESEVDITKFRPNIVVEGADEAFEEDYWGELVVKTKQNGTDSVRFVLTQNCARCNSLNVDYETGKVGEGEKGRLLATLSKDRRVDPGAKWSPIFGRYGFLAGRKILEGGEVILRVGGEVKVTKRNDDRTSFGKYSRLLWLPPSY